MTHPPDSGQKRNHFWDAVMAALLTAALLASAAAATYTTYLNTQQHTALADQYQRQQLVDLYWQKLQHAEDAASKGDYPACKQILEGVPADADFYQQVQSLANECYQRLNQTWLENAEAMAADNRLKDAIDEASRITRGPLQAQAGDRIKTWSQQIIDLAKQRYFAPTDQFNEAVNIISRLPNSSPLYETSRDILNQWQQEWAGNQRYYQMAKLALARGDLVRAEEFAQSISSHQIWASSKNQILVDVEETRQQFEQIVREAEDLRNERNLGAAALKIQQLPMTEPWHTEKKKILAQIDIQREERNWMPVAVSIVGALMFVGILKQLF